MKKNYFSPNMSFWDVTDNDVIRTSNDIFSVVEGNGDGDRKSIDYFLGTSES